MGGLDTRSKNYRSGLSLPKCTGSILVQKITHYCSGLILVYPIRFSVQLLGPLILGSVRTENSPKCMYFTILFHQSTCHRLPRNIFLAQSFAHVYHHITDSSRFYTIVNFVLNKREYGTWEFEETYSSFFR